MSQVKTLLDVAKIAARAYLLAAARWDGDRLEYESKAIRMYCAETAMTIGKTAAQLDALFDGVTDDLAALSTESTEEDVCRAIIAMGEADATKYHHPEFKVTVVIGGIQFISQSMGLNEARVTADAVLLNCPKITPIVVPVIIPVTSKVKA